jgi:hypothetical protein
MTDTGPRPPVADDPSGAGDGLSRTGIIAGTALRTARLSARITESALAGAWGASEPALRSLESGASSLATVPMPFVKRLEDVLLEAGARPELVADLEIAAWCDLVIEVIAAGEDATSLLADPLSGGHAFRELMAWSLGGGEPDRYRTFASPAPRLTDSSLVERIIGVLNATLPASGAARWIRS